jgi:tetratricopeptide (TPR) repeat protein
MRRAAWLAAALALAACDREVDPLAESRAACADVERAPQDRVAACSTLLETGELDDAARAETQAHRGAAQRAAGDVTAALRDFESALRLDADQPAALEGRASILLASGQLDAAEPLIDRLIALGHALSVAHVMKGDIAALRGDHPAAIASYDAALEEDRSNALAYAHRARSRQRQGDADGARADYDAAIRTNGALAEARAGRCWLNLREERDFEQARNDAEAAAAAEPGLVEAQLCRGVLQLRGGEWASAQASFEAALAVESGNPIALFGRGVARRRSGDAQGREDMNLARDFDRRIGETFDDWGVETY